MRKKELVYSFHCDFCNKTHKHNYLGHQDCRCNSVYSPYSNSGYNFLQPLCVVVEHPAGLVL